MPTTSITTKTSTKVKVIVATLGVAAVAAAAAGFSGRFQKNFDQSQFKRGQQQFGRQDKFGGDNFQQGQNRGPAPDFGDCTSTLKIVALPPSKTTFSNGPKIDGASIVELTNTGTETLTVKKIQVQNSGTLKLSSVGVSYFVSTAGSTGYYNLGTIQMKADQSGDLNPPTYLGNQPFVLDGGQTKKIIFDAYINNYQQATSANQTVSVNLTGITTIKQSCATLIMDKGVFGTAIMGVQPVFVPITPSSTVQTASSTPQTVSSSTVKQPLAISVSLSPNSPSGQSFSSASQVLMKFVVSVPSNDKSESVVIKDLVFRFFGQVQLGKILSVYKNSLNTQPVGSGNFANINTTGSVAHHIPLDTAVVIAPNTSVTFYLVADTSNDIPQEGKSKSITSQLLEVAWRSLSWPPNTSDIVEDVNVNGKILIYSY